jgi:hypothetical protein
MTDNAWLLLSDPSPTLRHRVLTELLDVPASDEEVQDLAVGREREIEALLTPEPGDLKEQAWMLCRAAYLGADRTRPVVAALAERVLARQLGDGSFPLRAFRSGRREERYSLVPLQVSLPLRGLAAVGYALDPRVERAYEWLLAQRLDDGSWPTGIASGQPAFVAGYRKLPGARGCRVNTQSALACLVQHPQRRGSEAAQRALDLLLQRETRDEAAIGTDLARLLGFEPATGFFTFYARFDLAFVVRVAADAGASVDDRRVRDLADFLSSRRGRGGLWEHPAYPSLSRWLTFDLLRNLGRLETGDWVGVAPRTRFRPYARPWRY